jgi:hypothetical protein
VTSIADSDPTSDVQVFPNPNSGVFTVNFNREITSANVCVFDIFGNCILQKNSVGSNTTECQSTMCITLQQQPRGVYFVQLTAEGKRSTRKVVID